MAALIQALVISGSRLSTGEPNDTGVVYAYQPGTTSPAVLYADADAATVITQPIVLDNGGRIPYDTYPDGVWITAPIRLLVQDVTGQTVTDSTYWTSDARTDALDNDGWTGDTVDEALTAIWASVGGIDGKYQESGGATARPIQDKFREQGIWVTDFGAVGNGIAIDTTAIQTGMNRAKALSCSLLFPAGNFIIDQAISVTSAVGLRLIGAGASATFITSTNATANGFTFVTTDDLIIEGMTLSHATTSTGNAIDLTTCARAIFRGVNTDVANGFKYGLALTTSSRAALYSCRIAGDGNSGAGILSTASHDWLMIGGSLDGDLYSVVYDGASADVSMYGVEILEPTRYAATLTGTKFSYYGCNSNQSVSVATATIPGIRNFASGVLSSSGSAAVGGSITPSLLSGNEIVLTASSGGAGTVTVNNPAVLPLTNTTDGRDLFWDFLFKNAASGAVTWSLGTAYIVSAAIPTTDAHSIRVRFGWDPAAGKLREASRSDTVT